MGKIIKKYKYKGTLKEKEVNDKDCLSKTEVLKLIGQENWKTFDKWMFGQAGPIMSDNTCGYYSWDVQKFKRFYIDKEDPATPDDLMNIFQDMEMQKIEIGGSLGKINTREWNSSRKGIEMKNNQRNKKKKPATRNGLKRTKLRRNKKTGVREKSKKGSRDKIYWSD